MQQQIFSALILVGAELIKIGAKKVGVPIANKLLCKMGIHDWQVVEGEKDLYVCSRCHITEKLKVKDAIN